LAGEETPHRALRRLAMRLGVLRDASATTGGGVVFLGYLKGASLQTALAEAHAGIIPMVPDARVGIPNKLVDYAAAGLPILSCIGGESERLLDEAHAGWFYPCHDSDALAALVRRLYDAPATLHKAARGARDLAERRFDGETVSRTLADFLELPLT
jgi:glycosyltransferase involved in cell wall biosynthesis